MSWSWGFEKGSQRTCMTNTCSKYYCWALHSFYRIKWVNIFNPDLKYIYLEVQDLCSFCVCIYGLDSQCFLVLQRFHLLQNGKSWQQDSQCWPATYTRCGEILQQCSGPLFQSQQGKKETLKSEVLKIAKIEKKVLFFHGIIWFLFAASSGYNPIYLQADICHRCQSRQILFPWINYETSTLYYAVTYNCDIFYSRKTLKIIFYDIQ